MKVVELSIGSTMKGIVLKPITTGINLAGTKPNYFRFGYVLYNIQVAKKTALLII